MTLQRLLLLLGSAVLLFTAATAARCTLREDAEFTLTTFDAAELNNTLVSVSGAGAGAAGLRLPSALRGAHFHAGGMYRRVVEQNKAFNYQAYLTPAAGDFRFAAHPPADAVTGPFEIGCDYYGRHFLVVAGVSEWTACRLPGRNAGWKVGCSPWGWREGGESARADACAAVSSGAARGGGRLAAFPSSGCGSTMFSSEGWLPGLEWLAALQRRAYGGAEGMVRRKGSGMIYRFLSLRDMRIEVCVRSDLE